MSRATEIIGRVEKQDQNSALVDKPQLRPLNFSARIPELDGLRGVAIGLVLFYHYVTIAIDQAARPPELLGYVLTATRFSISGVDLFFVLSGFLIGGILLDARNSPNYFKTFYFRRLCRIMPIYFLFIGLVGISYLFVYRPVGAPLDFVFAGKLPWYSYLSFAQNLWMAKLNTVGATILGSTWSLAIEEQFYLVLPIIIRFVHRPALPYVFMAGMAIAPVLRFCVGILFPTNWWAISAQLPCRMDPLFLGALCAYCLREPGVWSRLARQRRALWIVFFMFLAGTFILNIPLNSFKPPLDLVIVTVSYGWIALFYATVLLLALTDSQSFLSRVLRWRWLAGLGAIAYSVYLFHSGVYGLCMWLFTGHGWLLASWADFVVILYALAITIVLSKMSWEFFEKPFVRWGHNWRY